jgi:tRNA nucleotidyltransferase (CCA-adding enzyme)
VALPRTEKKNGIGHKGFDVIADKDLDITIDLFRRDFTINSIAINVITNKIIDPFGGLDDIQNKIIKITNPDAFADDSLRILRGIQFSSRFDFDIEKNTLEFMKSHSESIKDLSADRILGELMKMATKSINITRAFTLLAKLQVVPLLFNASMLPFNNCKINIVADFFFILLSKTKNADIVFKNKLNGDCKIEKDLKAISFAWNNVSDDNMENIKTILKMFKISSNSIFANVLPDNIKSLIETMCFDEKPFTATDLNINGNDLIELGFNGEIIGKILNELLIAVASDKIDNKHEDLKQFVRSNF